PGSPSSTSTSSRSRSSPRSKASVDRDASRSRAFADLHTHSRASFDSLASPEAMLRTAASRGLTHLAITDHDRIDGAVAARDLAARIAPEVTVIVGEEIKTLDGDLVALHLTEAVPPGLP